MKTTTSIPKGMLFTVTSGEYSDYQVHGVFRALEEINADELKAQWIAMDKSRGEPYHFNDTGFIAWIAKSGLLEPVDSLEFFVGAYNMGDVEVRKIDTEEEDMWS